MSVKETLKARRIAEETQREAAEKTALALALEQAGIEAEENNVESNVESEKETTMSNVVNNTESTNPVAVRGSVQMVGGSGQSTTASLMETSDLRTSLADVVIIVAERGYRNYNEVVTSLDLINPSFVILDGTTNASNIAMSWARSRQRQFRVMTPNWGDNGENATAGIERNQAVVKLAAEMVQQDNVKVLAAIYRTNERDDRGALVTFDTAVSSILQIIEKKNETLSAAPVEYHKYMLEMIDVPNYLVQDAICAGAEFEVAPGVYVPIPEPKVRIGTRDAAVTTPNW